MYELPVIESNSPLKINKLRNHNFLQQFKVQKIKKDLSMKHPLSHQILHIVFWHISVQTIQADFKMISHEEISKYPIPRPLERYFVIKYK